MIARYPGICRYCKKPIEVGRDEFDIDKRINYHVECVENPAPGPPGREAYVLADKLGYIPSSQLADHRWTKS
jgi:hypothetical protein